MKAVLAFVSGVYLICAILAASLGLDYMAEGRGLHPYLAFPVALVAAGLSYFAAHIGDLIEG